jgi:two-component system, chemotaxis family, protein-glutamate methylesterase/glutaminase
LPHHDIVAIGASAGGLSALTRLAAALPASIDAAILVVMHLKSDVHSRLAAILDRAGPLDAAFAEDGAPATRGRIHVAPPNRHLLLDGDTLRLSPGPWENGARPSVDTLFRSVAVCCAHRAIGVVLTGYLDDGSAGLRALRRCGGIAVVQDPADAEYPDMPRNALEMAPADHVTTVHDLAPLLTDLIGRPAAAARPVPRDITLEAEMMARGEGDMDVLDRIGERSVFTCPDCGGVLWQIQDGHADRYRCHVGHSYSAQSFDHALSRDVLRAMETALRTLDERARMIRQLGSQAKRQSRHAMARHWNGKADVIQQQAEEIRAALLQLQDLNSPI